MHKNAQKCSISKQKKAPIPILHIIIQHGIVVNSSLTLKVTKNQYIMLLRLTRKKRRHFAQKIDCLRKLRKKITFFWFFVHFKRRHFFIWRFLESEIGILAFHWVDLSNALRIIPVRPIEKKRRRFYEKNQKFNKNFQYIKALTFASLFWVHWEVPFSSHRDQKMKSKSVFFKFA